VEGFQGDGLLKGGSLKVVFANGVFDPFHVGHLYYLEEARKQGDHLIVGVASDRHVQKGPGRPLFNAEERARVIRALRIVDDVAIVEDVFEALRIIRPDVYVKGLEYAGKLKEQELVESLGGRVHFTNGPVYSSTKLVTGGYLRLPRIASR
jgi:rfaE bifunctional protein nucleotidyltransferase chain/domain